MRSLPKRTAKNKIGSVDQNIHRSRFSKMQHFLAPLLNLIKVGFKLEATGTTKSAHNMAKSYNMLHAFNEENEIDCSKVLLCYGKLASPINAAVIPIATGFQFTWAFDPREKHANIDDQVMMVAYNTDNREAYFTISGAKRPLGMDDLLIPGVEKGNVFHTWIAFIANDRESISMSRYIGEMVY